MVGVIGIGDQLRRLPAVGALLSRPEIVLLLEQLPRETVLASVQQAVAEARSSLQAIVAAGSGHPSGAAAGNERPADDQVLADWVTGRAAALANRAAAGELRRVVNATGIVLHTNLGRAVMSPRAVAAVAEAASHYTNLEYNVLEGRRGSRQDHLRGMIRLLSGAEDGMAVNNNAGAVLLVLNTLAEGREVIVSRGELVEIGGSFRIPDVMRKSGARLVEVGTTNRTHPEDYRRAVGPETGLLLKVHTSNYRIVGFTSEVSAEELSAIGSERGIPVLYDLGSGAAFDFQAAGIPGEPTLRSAVSMGAAVVTASGDKLLGGPQAGIIAGRADLLDKARRNPLARALRLDKLTIAGLQATLLEYLMQQGDGGRPSGASLPVVEMITRSGETLRSEAEALAGSIAAAVGDDIVAEVVPGKSEVGGGAFPEIGLSTWLVAVKHRTLGATELAAGMRESPVPVIARVEQDRVVLDPRTLLPGDFERVLEAVRLAGRRPALDQRR